MKKKNRLLLVESEMKGPSGHFLDNLIETTNTFRKKLNIDWIVNKDFDHQNTFIPDKIKIFKYISTNKFKRKENKIFYLLEELYLFFLNIYYVFFFSFFFLITGKFSHYIKALRSNYFLLPRYFISFYFKYKDLKLSKNDHIFFQTARRKDIALINFITKIHNDHPIFHIRVMLPPKKKFKGFFYYLNELNGKLKKGRVFVYLFSVDTHKLFLKNSLSREGILMSNVPSSFYNRKVKYKTIIGFVGNPRRSRGFHLIPKLIDILEKNNNSFNYLIQFFKVPDNLLKTKDELYSLSKQNKKIRIIEKYCDYKQFRDTLKKIDIMPILSSANEINKNTSATMYSCITHQIPFIIPKGTNFMNNIIKFKSFEKGNSLNEKAKCILKISRNYKFYLKNGKLNSNILKNILRNDPLRKNIF